jgi:hypothetical protein
MSFFYLKLGKGNGMGIQGKKATSPVFYSVDGFL